MMYRFSLKIPEEYITILAIAKIISIIKYLKCHIGDVENSLLLLISTTEVYPEYLFFLKKR